jgi:hypothetical protein
MALIEQAISLLKEIRIISGINSRKYTKRIEFSDKKGNGYLMGTLHKKKFKREFDYINMLIDKFKDKHKIDGFKE